jgi:hypothetical protein
MYGGLALDLNRTRIVATKTCISRAIRPIPTAKGISRSSSGIKQFFAVNSAVRTSDQGYVSNAIYFIDANDHVWCLAANLPSSFAAHHICHELEDFYGIEDMDVYGVTTDPSHPGPRS